MQLLPSSSFQKFMNSVRQSPPKPQESTTTNISALEKEAATYKLEEFHPAHRERSFNWKNFVMAFFTLILLTTATLASIALAVDKDNSPDLVAKLKMANTALDRLDLLPQDSDWLFDFKAQDKYTFAPGGVVNANAATFPATVGNGLTMAMLNLGPCAMLPPHLHPRASNFVVAVQGSTDTYMVMENGARTVRETLTPGKMTIFPQGSVHTMQNTGCGNAQLVSALAADDTGTTNLANTLFGLPPDIVGAAVGGNVSVASVERNVPPVGTGSSLGSEECRRRCGM